MKYEEKIKKRKEHHSAIERKRREKISECMEMLRRLVPANQHQENPQKLTILQNTVEYLQYLQKHQQYTFPLPKIYDLESVDTICDIYVNEKTSGDGTVEMVEVSNPSKKVKCRKMSIDNMLT
ncbi:hypothetical protein BC833DRAFT_618773 [Globomyces pollinis-pini]|nr:hypothetical protein BC833DRAFT_618773 [Globomyces pollinis-pini]